MGAAADCERIIGDLIGQPVNTLTTLAFAIAALTVWGLPRSRWVSLALMATGIGSFLFHGPLAPGGEWPHDVTLAWLLLVVAASGRKWEEWSRVPGLMALGALFAVLPEVSDPVSVLLAAMAIALVLKDDRSAATLGPLALLTIGAVVGRLGATGGPLCDPDSIWQPHGLWHLVSAGAVAWWARNRARRDSTSSLHP